MWDIEVFVCDFGGGCGGDCGNLCGDFDGWEFMWEEVIWIVVLVEDEYSVLDLFLFFLGFG